MDLHCLPPSPEAQDGSGWEEPRGDACSLPGGLEVPPSKHAARAFWSSLALEAKH